MLHPLTLLAERTGVAVIIVRHHTKGSDPNPINRGGGSIGFTAAARPVFMVGGHPDDPENRRMLARVKGILARPVLSLSYHLGEDSER